MAEPRIPLTTRFWAKVQKTDSCWNWTGVVNSYGYGRVFIRKRKRLSITDGAHRVAWELHFGTIPDGLLVCHHCDNPRCVRPDHLFLGTDRDNMHDRNVKGRASRGERHHRAKLTEADILAIRARFAAGGISKQRLAEQYGVLDAAIGKIIRRELWRHI